VGAKHFTIEGRHVDVVARPLSGLGWTWTYLLDGLPEVKNPGALQASEEQAFAAAIKAAAESLRGRQSA
jgi:hypothetical protein